MARRRAVSNPLALAVLACLYERPMHPYEMAATLRERGKEHSIKLNYGSLYTVVDNLAKHRLIEAMEAQREGRRPERTVYQITGPGRAELQDWMAELLAEPVKEYPRFEAALSLLPVVPPGRVLDLLQDRISALEAELAELDTLVAAAAHTMKLPRLVLIEGEYHIAMRRAELHWVRGLAAELAAGTLEGVDGWRRWHETGEWPEMEELQARARGTDRGLPGAGEKGAGATD